MLSLVIKNIGIGLENGEYYVQTCCKGEHKGQECDCKTLIENVSQYEAIELAEEKSKELNVPIQKWYLNSTILLVEENNE